MNTLGEGTIGSGTLMSPMPYTPPANEILRCLKLTIFFNPAKIIVNEVNDTVKFDDHPCQLRNKYAIYNETT